MTLERKNLLDPMDNGLRRNKYLLGAFFLPFVVLAICFWNRGIYPVGNRDVLTIDAYHQYAPFMAELQARYQSFSSLFYTWSGGLGTNFYALFAYYLASPLNIIIVLFPASNVTEAILLLILTKVGLAGACFYYYLREVHHREGVLGVALSLMYAVSNYLLAYFWNIMWLDALFLLPLLILGLVRIIRDRRYLLYTLCLGLTLASNYYIAYFVCLFIALYFPIALFLYQEGPRVSRLLIQTAQFIGLTLLGAGLSAFLSVPTYLAIQLTSAANDPFPKTIIHAFDLFDYIGQHFMMTPPTIRDGLPNMYSGLLALILIPIYFLSRQVTVKAKLLHLCLILVMILSFNINVLNFIWNGFHYPNQLPYRYSFVYIFLILSLAYPALRSLREFSGKQLGMIISSLMLLVLLAQKLNDKTPPVISIYVTLAFLAFYAIVLTMDRIHHLHPSDVAMALLLVVVAEILINTLVTMHVVDTTEVFSSREGYMDGVEVDEIRDELAKIKAGDPGFYRVESLPPRTTNDGFMYQYRGLSIFASTISTKPVRLFENFGYHSNSINSYKYEGSTLVADSIFGIKYLIRRSGFIHDTLRQQISKTDELEVYENPYALPLGMLGSFDLTDWSSSNGNPFLVQNSLLEALGGQPDVLRPIATHEGIHSNMILESAGENFYSYDRTYENQGGKIQMIIDNTQDQQVYLYLDVTANEPDQGFVMIDDERVDFNAKRSTLIDLGYVKADAKIVFTLTYKSTSNTSGNIELYSYGLDQAAFASSISQIRQSGLQITQFKDTHIEGTVSAANDGTMMLTTPYDSGWQVKVDGETVETFAIDESLLAFYLLAGDHTVELNYTPPGFTYGLLISLASVLLLIFIYLLPAGPGRAGRRRAAALRTTAWRTPGGTLPEPDSAQAAAETPDGTAAAEADSATADAAGSAAAADAAAEPDRSAIPAGETVTGTPPGAERQSDLDRSATVSPESAQALADSDQTAPDTSRNML